MTVFHSDHDDRKCPHVDDLIKSLKDYEELVKINAEIKVDRTTWTVGLAALREEIFVEKQTAQELTDTKHLAIKYSEEIKHLEMVNREKEDTIFIVTKQMNELRDQLAEQCKISESLKNDVKALTHLRPTSVNNKCICASTFLRNANCPKHGA